MFLSTFRSLLDRLSSNQSSLIFGFFGYKPRHKLADIASALLEELFANAVNLLNDWVLIHVSRPVVPENSYQLNLRVLRVLGPRRIVSVLYRSK